MADQPIEQFLRRTPKRKRPNHIAMPTEPAVSCAKQLSKSGEKVVSKDLTALASLPRPPVPPRRHTLAEICRYADEQCAYIEWMTRELEAEEAARSHSMPTTPAGAITNPFSGPADMWWRPISANEMYGKSALRRQQEEEEKARLQHPYLAANGLPEFFETNRLKQVDCRIDGNVGTLNQETESILFSPRALEDHTVHVAESRMFPDEPVDDIPKCFRSPAQYDAWPRRARVSASNQASQGWKDLDPPCLKQDSIFLMIPKAMICFLLLPLILITGWFSASFSEDEEG